jgi:hypothetical protein
VLKGLEGKKLPAGEFPPQALTTFELCKTFKCLPSQLEQEDNKTIEEMLVIMNTIAEHDSKANKKQKREEAKKKYSGGNSRG